MIRCGCIIMRSDIVVVKKLFPPGAVATSGFVAVREGGRVTFWCRDIYAENVAAGLTQPGSSYQLVQ
jgi:hypothetical protein